MSMNLGESSANASNDQMQVEFEEIDRNLGEYTKTTEDLVTESEMQIEAIAKSAASVLFRVYRAEVLALSTPNGQKMTERIESFLQSKEMTYKFKDNLYSERLSVFATLRVMSHDHLARNYFFKGDASKSGTPEDAIDAKKKKANKKAKDAMAYLQFRSATTKQHYSSENPLKKHYTDFKGSGQKKWTNYVLPNFLTAIETEFALCKLFCSHYFNSLFDISTL